MTASRKERLKGGGMEQKGKRTHGHGQQCGDYWGEVDITGLKGNGKNTIEIHFKKRKEKIIMQHDECQRYTAQLCKTLADPAAFSEQEELGRASLSFFMCSHCAIRVNFL